jgi:competence protein ComEC
VKGAAAWIAARVAYVPIVCAAAGLALAGLSPIAPLLVAVVVVVATAAAVPGRAAALAGLALAIGGLAGTARLEAIDAPGGRLADGQRIAGLAHLTEAPRPGPFGSSVEVAMASGGAREGVLVARLARGTGLPAHAGPGLEVALSGRFQRVRTAAGKDFDYGAYLRRRGIAGELLVDRLRVTGGRRDGLAGAVDRIRDRADRALASELAPTPGALARGMVLGADEAIPRGVRDDFRDSGLAHLLAVSGQNVLLLCALAIPLLAAAGLSRSARIPVLLALIALYVPLAGAGPSIQRAGVMGAAALLAVALSRPVARWHALGLAACATLALEPRACAEPGWQLSFAAVAGILLLAPGIRRSLGVLPRAAAEGVALTVAATLATAPLVAHHFGAIPLAGLPANVVALPLVAPIMWIGMLRAALGQLVATGGLPAVVASTASSMLGMALEPLLRGLEGVAALFADAPGGQLELTLGSPAMVAVAYAAIAAAAVAASRLSRTLDTRASTAVAYLRRLPRRRKVALAVAALALTALLVARGLAPAGPPATLTVTFLDVGQGDATLVQHPDGSAVLFDGGPPEGGVARLLRRAGVRRLSAVVMTHASRDHHGGLAEVVERFPVDVLVDGGDGARERDFRAVVAAATARGARRVKAVAPLTLAAGSLRIDILSPPPRPPGLPPEDPNPRAVVAVVSCDGFELLLSGDAESEALLPLGLPDVEAMKVPHHGSSDPGLPEVLERSRPEVASIPVGLNSYGHPAPSTLTALRRARVQTWRNDRNGSVRVTVDHGELSVRPERGEPVDRAP